MSSRIKMIALMILVFLSRLAGAADVVFLSDPRTPSAALPALELACRFYGLELSTIPVSAGTDQQAKSALLSEGRLLAVVASAGTLTNGAMVGVLEALKRQDGSRVPILIADLAAESNGGLLTTLSDGRLSWGESFRGETRPGRYEVGAIERVARELARRSFRASLLDVETLSGDPADGIRTIIGVTLENGGATKPVFMMAARNGQEWFYLTRCRVTCPLYAQRPPIDEGRILEALPMLMFVRYAGGPRCWQSPGYFANLTIDDPWLREPYGDLHFAALLREMERANFHTTLAFIPWNYDRSQAAVVSLFRDHPDRYSLCIHGNDHDRSEFTDPNSARHREGDIVQGLARMEAFTRLTGIGVDRVMVFPHTIASDAETLAALKKYNFLATFNQDNVPLSLPRPRELSFYLRAVTQDYGDFPSVNRAGVAGQTASDFALELFLGNPILLYDHHDLFRTGVDRFNRLAETINGLGPSVRWATLGTVARHLYLTRARDDGESDVLAMCRSLELENPGPRDMTFHVHKPDAFAVPIRRLTVDGRPCPYERTAGGIDLVVTVPAGATALIDLEYENDYAGSSVSIAKASTRVRILRGLSDFRDIRLSSFPLGRAVIRLFYGSGAYRAARGRIIVFGSVVLAAIALLLWILWRRRRRNRARRRAAPVADPSDQSGSR